MVNYAEFLARKTVAAPLRGLADVPPLNSAMFAFQRMCCEFALRAGCAAMFLDTGLGKTFIQLEWARVVHEHTGGNVLILTPLAVSRQTVREGAKFGIGVTLCRSQEDVRTGVNITNYERLEKFDAGSFVGVVLDESSILKSFTGTVKRALCAAFAETPYRLACTATPAPNDHMEIGNHSQFLGVMDSAEMLSRWFITDQSEMGKYRLKGHAVESFWNWVASWARCISRPSDLGEPDDGFILPPLDTYRHLIRADVSVETDGALFRMPEMSATSMHREKRLTVPERASKIAALVNGERNELWVVWCDTNYEADAVTALIPDAIEVRGSEQPDAKERKLIAFSEGAARVIVTKASIAGYGLNWQHCARMAFVGLNFSYEMFYQAVRRCWRFGQTRPVDVHVALADTELAIWDVITRKADGHNVMKLNMTAAMKRAQESRTVKLDYDPRTPRVLPAWLKGEVA